MTAGHNFCYKPPRVATAMALLTRFHSSASPTVDALVPSTRPPGTVPRLDTATCILTSSATLRAVLDCGWFLEKESVQCLAA